MVTVMKAGAEQQYIDAVIAQIKALNYTPHPIQGTERTVIAAIGDQRGKYELRQLASIRGVDKVVPILEPHNLSGSEIRPGERTKIQIGEVEIGGDTLILMAGPCSVESREQIWNRQKSSRRRAHRFCEAERSNRVHSRIVFKDLGRKVWNTSPKRGTKLGS